MLHIAQYLFEGVGAPELAIDALFRLQRQGELSLAGRHQLCSYLQRSTRWGEATEVLIAMIEESPDVLEYHTMLMLEYFHTDQPELLQSTLTATEAHFKEIERWNEATVATLGLTCLKTKLAEDCVRFYDEAIALHVKSSPTRGIGDGVLSQYYGNLSGAYRLLGNTWAAVDAAAGAVVAWGPSRDERDVALETLRRALVEAQDLGGVVAEFERESAETGVENPVLRKAIAAAFMERGEPRKAAHHYDLAVEMEPNDLESQRARVAAWDAAGERERATESLLESAMAASTDLRLFVDLGNRLSAGGNAEEAERAFTTVVEKKPEESESHQALAEVRESQDRFEDAVHHWREVTRIRSQEPTGYLRLARVLVRTGEAAEAEDILEMLLGQSWDERFGDVHQKAKEILKQLSN